MNTLVIVVIAACCLAAGYLLYGRWLAHKWGIDPNAKTPAITKEDGQDYVPTDGWVVFAHQFSSIAGAGPVTGAIQAAVFGWVPVFLWIILGGIFSGYFTPSEAAAVAVVYALLVSTFVYRDMSFKKLYTTMLGSAKTSAVIMIIIACSGPFGWALANWKIPEAISTAVLSVSTNKYVILFLISLIILIAGVFMETSSAIIILTPVFLPLVRALGISTLHFGILFVVGIAIGMITPPVAINLFVASGITGLSLEKISKAVVPYLIGLVIVFLLIVYLPLFIPGFIG